MARLIVADAIPDGQAALLPVLLDALAGVPLSAAERDTLTWLAGFDAEAVESVAAIIRRARVVKW